MLKAEITDKLQDLVVPKEIHDELLILVAQYYLAFEEMTSDGLTLSEEKIQELTHSFACTIAYDVLGASARPTQCLKYGQRLFRDILVKDLPTGRVKAHRDIS